MTLLRKHSEAPHRPQRPCRPGGGDSGRGRRRAHRAPGDHDRSRTCTRSTLDTRAERRRDSLDEFSARAGLWARQNHFGESELGCRGSHSGGAGGSGWCGRCDLCSGKLSGILTGLIFRAGFAASIQVQLPAGRARDQLPSLKRHIGRPCCAPCSGNAFEVASVFRFLEFLVGTSDEQHIHLCKSTQTCQLVR